jgi:hypothetical protein
MTHIARWRVRYLVQWALQINNLREAMNLLALQDRNARGERSFARREERPGLVYLRSSK